MAKAGINIKAVLFDFDGTLTQPGAIDFQLIKRVKILIDINKRVQNLSLV